MKSIALTTNRQTPLTESWLDMLARKMVHKALRRLSRGSLTLIEEEREFTFGNPSADFDIHARIEVKHLAAYRYVLFGGTIGSAEGYMLGAWSTANLVAVIRVFVANMAVIEALDSGFSTLKQGWNALQHKFRGNSRKNAKINIAAHYDLGNEFYKLFLDESMMYSSAVFPHSRAELGEASWAKIKQVCEQLQLAEGEHLLEIGSGWGGLAIYAAKNYGCRVTSVTLSQQQHRHASEWAKREGVAHLVEFRLQDYRDIQGQFDKIVSIEMIEAVGHEYFGRFFNQCAALLKADGLMLIQAITIADQRYEREKDNVDFIQAYIFPGGCLPSVTALCSHMGKDSDFNLVGLTEIGHHYAETLAVWRKRFMDNLDKVRAQGFDETFIRMWEFYFCYCEGGFRERVIGTSQMLFAKPGYRFPG